MSDADEMSVSDEMSDADEMSVSDEMSDSDESRDLDDLDEEFFEWTNEQGRKATECMERWDDAAREEFDELHRGWRKCMCYPTLLGTASRIAAFGGHVHWLKYMGEHYLIDSVGAMWNAAMYGHLACFKYSYEYTVKHGPIFGLCGPFDFEDCGDLCAIAAEHGHFEILRYAREVNLEGVEAYADVLDEYARAWVDFVVHAILSRRETADGCFELSARRFRDLYKTFDAHRAHAKTRARDLSRRPLND